MPKKRTTEQPQQFFAKKDPAYVVYEIYKKGRKTVYFIRGNQNKFVDKIILKGYLGLPNGLFLNKEGYGFSGNSKGYYFLEQLHTQVLKGQKKRLELVISSGQKQSIKSTSTSIVVTLPLSEIKPLLIRFGRINSENNADLREEACSFLSTKFRKQVKVSNTNFDEYKGGELHALLNKKDVDKRLNEDDLLSLSGLYPKVVTLPKGRGKIGVQRAALLQAGSSASQRTYLDQIIGEFEKYIKKPTLSEATWQNFLKDKVFKFLWGYVATIEKENVSLDVSYPDFVLVDVYGFLDVFEIKKHSAGLLAFDSSHDNYYWKPEIARAIAQIENYVDHVVHFDDDLIKKIKRSKGIEVKVVRPRGFIIAGISAQFRNDKERDDFRKLSSALKNIDFILYDQILANLKNLRAKL